MKKVLLFLLFLSLFHGCRKEDQNAELTKPLKNRNEKGKTLYKTLPPGVASMNHEGGKYIRKSASSFQNTVRITDTSHGFSGVNETGERIKKIRLLRSKGIIPDMNEPLTKRFFYQRADSVPFISLVAVSKEAGLLISFDNDILDYTDRFYTNGIRVDLILPGLQSNPFSRLLLPSPFKAVNYYGLALMQNMYTPSTTKIGGILYGDRPYSAYLCLGTFKITNDIFHQYRQTSELDIGIIGPDSYGEWVQRSFHNAVPTNNEPLGWEYQIKNDVVLQYSASAEKGIISGKGFELMANAKGNLGTLYTNLALGLHIRSGWMNSWICSPLPLKKDALTLKKLRHTQFYIFVKGTEQWVGYDATLQGGLFNKTSVYTIPASGINRLVFKGSLGLSCVINGIELDAEQFVLSPEFTGGLWHKWVHIGLRFGL